MIRSKTENITDLCLVTNFSTFTYVRQEKLSGRQKFRQNQVFYNIDNAGLNIAKQEVFFT